jgi:hypothetical protein
LPQKRLDAYTAGNDNRAGGGGGGGGEFAKSRRRRQLYVLRNPDWHPLKTSIWKPDYIMGNNIKEDLTEVDEKKKNQYLFYEVLSN